MKTPKEILVELSAQGMVLEGRTLAILDNFIAELKKKRQQHYKRKTLYRRQLKHLRAGDMKAAREVHNELKRMRVLDFKEA